MDRDDGWSRLIAAAGAIGAAVALVYVIGGASLSLRYEGFGLPGQQTAAQTPREVLLAAGLRTVAAWALFGVVLVLALRALPDRMERAVAGSLGRPAGALAALAGAVALFLALNVWWPLATYGAALAILLASAHWKQRPLRRALVSALAVALVAVAYEADRIDYYVERTCVTPAQASRAGPVCGALIGQQDRGFYLGVPLDPHPPRLNVRPQRLVFLPSARVGEASSTKQLVRVTDERARARRKWLPSRLAGLSVR